MSEKNTKGLLRCFGTRIFQIGTVFLSQTFIFLCFSSRFLLSTPLFRPSAEQGPQEALAPGHGQIAPWPYEALGAVRTRFFRFQAARTISLNKKQPKYHDILKAKRLGIID